MLQCAVAANTNRAFASDLVPWSHKLEPGEQILCCQMLNQQMHYNHNVYLSSQEMMYENHHDVTVMCDTVAS